MTRVQFGWGPALWMAVVAGVIAGGWMGAVDRRWMNDLWYIAYAVVQASAWNILGGLAGQVSFGYAAFLGIGAYTTVLLALAGIPGYATIPLGAVIAAVFSLLIGLPTFRLRGPYFSIATLGVSEAVRVIMQGMEWTGGSAGKRMPPGMSSFLTNYTAMVALAGAVVVLVWILRRTRFGLALDAIRQDADAAQALGIAVTGYKSAADALSAALTAVAGSLYVMNFEYVAPSAVFSFNVGLSFVLMPVIGGIGTVAGPVLGGVLFSVIQNKLLASLPNLHLLTYGALLIGIMLYEPRGLLGIGDRLITFVQRARSVGRSRGSGSDPVLGSRPAEEVQPRA